METQERNNRVETVLEALKNLTETDKALLVRLLWASGNTIPTAGKRVNSYVGGEDSVSSWESVTSRTRSFTGRRETYYAWGEDSCRIRGE